MFMATDGIRGETRWERNDERDPMPAHSAVSCAIGVTKRAFLEQKMLLGVRKERKRSSESGPAA
jgi:hypothetical protein